MTTSETDHTEQAEAPGGGGPAKVPAAVKVTYAGVLAAYKAVNDRVNELDRERRALRKLVDVMPAGTYDNWQKALGEPAEYVDMDKVAELLAKHGYEMPKKKGNPSLQVIDLSQA